MQSIYITRIASNGLAEKDDRLRPGDKLIAVSSRQKVTNVLSMACTHQISRRLQAISYVNFCYLRVRNRQMIINSFYIAIYDVYKHCDDKILLYWYYNAELVSSLF